jgi:hypothetical protein
MAVEAVQAQVEGSVDDWATHLHFSQPDSIMIVTMLQEYVPAFGGVLEGGG